MEIANLRTVQLLTFPVCGDVWTALTSQPVMLFWPKHRLGHPEIIYLHNLKTYFLDQSTQQQIKFENTGCNSLSTAEKPKTCGAQRLLLFIFMI